MWHSMAPRCNASKHKAMCHGQMLSLEKELEHEINALIRKAEILDALACGVFPTFVAELLHHG